MPFRVGLTRDFLNPRGEIAFGDIGLSLFDAAPQVQWEFLREDVNELTPAQVAEYDALLVLAPRVTARSLAGSTRLAVIARFGVGYDSVDVEACTQSNVALTITPDGVRRPVAVSALTLVLALSHKLLIKDRLTRAGRWAEKLNHMGQGVTGRTLGVIGLGNIGREIFRLAAPFEMKHLAADPYATAEQAHSAGARLVDLDALLRDSDYVVVCCALTEGTRHLLNAERLALMKPTAYLINVARGPIVDQRALTAVLQGNRIAGAGLDVFEQEPPDPKDPLFALENVIVAPHALCWTDECFKGNGESAIRSILDIASGQNPTHVVNRDVLGRPAFREKLERYKASQ
jgi:D-3-phosphoglycerate dehydrogenase